VAGAGALRGGDRLELRAEALPAAARRDRAQAAALLGRRVVGAVGRGGRLPLDDEAVVVGVDLGQLGSPALEVGVGRLGEERRVGLGDADLDPARRRVSRPAPGRDQRGREAR
jgi:hypothetical protein